MLQMGSLMLPLESTLHRLYQAMVSNDTYESVATNNIYWNTILISGKLSKYTWSMETVSSPD